MKTIHRALSLAAVAALLSGCGGGSNGGAVPSVTQANLGNDKLQLAVGTAFNAADGTTGLNIVTTFRQPNGLSAVAANEPSIAGPSGFMVPAGFPGAYGSVNSDDGTSAIESSPQVAVNKTAATTTLGDFTGAFSYGLAPLNSDNVSSQVYVPGYPNAYPGNGFTSSNYGSAANYYASLLGASIAVSPAETFPFFEEPFGAVGANQSVFLAGPPAVPFFNDGTAPSGFAGYSPGFTAFEVTPVAGSYSMKVTVPTTNGASPSFTATASLTSTASPLTAPVISSVTPTTGGLTGTVTSGAGAVETLVFITDYRFGINSAGAVALSSILYYTVEVKGTGAQTWTLPGTLGPCTSPGCENSPSAQTASLTLGDSTSNPVVPADGYTVQAISFDYAALEAGPPSNTSQMPAIAGSNGQADLSIGLSYPSTGTTGTFARHHLAIYRTPTPIRRLP